MPRPSACAAAFACALALLIPVVSADAGAPVPPPTTSTSTTPVSELPTCRVSNHEYYPGEDRKFIAMVRCLMNNERLSRGVPGLAANDILDAAALGHAKDMVARRYFDHYAPAPAGREPWNRAALLGYPGANATNGLGEDIGVGPLTPRKQVQNWMKSKGHCSEILKSTFVDFGLGVFKSKDSAVHWVANFGLLDLVPPTPASQTAMNGCPYTKLVTPPTTDPGFKFRKQTGSFDDGKLQLEGQVVGDQTPKIKEVEITVKGSPSGKTRRATVETESIRGRYQYDATIAPPSPSDRSWTVTTRLPGFSDPVIEAEHTVKR